MALVWTRINTLLLVILIGIGAAIITMLASRAYGGPLDPPNPVGSTSGVLEPGTPISSIPFTISQPGYYYLTRNLTASAAGTGITINANDVTLDLKGFLLTGLGADDGIDTQFYDRPIIRNGTIVNWLHGIYGFFSSGARYESVVFKNDTYAIDTGSFSTLSDCTVMGGTYGVYLRGHSTIQKCKFQISPAQFHVQAENNSKIAESFFDGSATQSAVAVKGDNIMVADNFFANTGTQVDIEATSDKIFLLGNWISCAGLNDQNPTATYHPLNDVTKDHTNWCY